uniref:Pheromone receptor n=1 Tax=Psilocybe cubensis TaxID=181762 RepID=A0A8H7Y630_PSICU
MSYPNEIYSAFSFIGFFLCAFSLPWQFESWNTGTCLYMTWAGLGCLNQFINSVMWNHNFDNRALVWCDVSTKFMIGLNVGIPAAGLCICRRLYHIASLKSLSVTERDKRRHVIVDLFIGIGLPVLEMVLHYIVQGHRFNIYEDFGCSPSTYVTWPALLIVFIPPIIIGIVSAIYAILNIIYFRRFSAKSSELFRHGSLTSSRYLRFIYLSVCEILFTIPLASYNTYYAASNMFPWISWSDTHADFSFVALVPTSIWRANKGIEANIELNRWIVVFCAFIFFAFFGISKEARRNYRTLYQKVSIRLGFSPPKAAQLAPIAFQRQVQSGGQVTSDNYVPSLVVDCETGHVSHCSLQDGRASPAHGLS